MTLGAGILPKPTDSWPTWLVVIYWIVMAIVGLGFLGVMIIKTFKFMKKGRAGILVRRGNPVLRDGKYVYKGPGIHPMFPFLDSIEDESVLQTTTNMPPFLAEKEEDDDTKVQYIIDARPAWRVENNAQAVHDSIFGANNLEEAVVRIIAKSFNRAVEGVENPNDKDSVEREMAATSKAILGQHGVLLDDPGLISVTRVPVQVLGELIGQSAQSVKNGAAAGVVLELVEG